MFWESVRCKSKSYNTKVAKHRNTKCVPDRDSEDLSCQRNAEEVEMPNSKQQKEVQDYTSSVYQILEKSVT